MIDEKEPVISSIQKLTWIQKECQFRETMARVQLRQIKIDEMLSSIKNKGEVLHDK